MSPRIVGVVVAAAAGLTLYQALAPHAGTEPTYACAGQQMTANEIAAHRKIDPALMPRLGRERALSPDAVCAMPQAKLDRALDKLEHPKPDSPGEANAFRQLSLRDENGRVPVDGLTRAYQHMQAMRLSQPAPVAGVLRGLWQGLGPGNIGGRIRTIAVHPTTPTTMFAGSVSGGIWRSVDGGTSWAAVTDFMANLAVSSIVFQPGNPSVMYAGTGEGYYNGDGIRGAGIFKSIDGGNTWAQLAATANASYLYVTRLSMSADGATLLAATHSGIYRSVNGGASFAGAGVAVGYGITDIDFHPSDASLAVASGYGVAWYSINGGANWTPAAGLPGAGSFVANRVEIAYAPSNPSIVYASVDLDGGSIYKSINGGASYALVFNGAPDYLGGQGWYDNALWVDPTNASVLIVGGLDLHRSIDGGVSLTPISTWWSAPNSAHADHHVVVHAPGFNGTSNKTVYFGNDGGVYRTTDVYTVGGASVPYNAGWTELNNNLGVTQFYGAAGNPTTGVIVGGTQDNGTLRYTLGGGSEGWTTMFGGDGGWSAADPTDPNYFYGEYVNLQLHRSNNGGLSSNWSFGLYNNGTGYLVCRPAPYSLGDACNGRAYFIAPFVLDPNDSNRFFAGGESLWRSNDIKAFDDVNSPTSGPQWQKIRQGNSSTSGYISAIAVAQGNSSVVWIGTGAGDVYRTANATAASPTWTRVDTNAPGLPNRYVTRVTIDPTNHNTVYVTFGGFSVDNVWKTTTNGSGWSDATGAGLTGLPDVPVRDLDVNPKNPTWLYAGTEVGVFASEDGGATWEVPQDGPANVSVDELFWMNNRLIAATHGRGLFQFSVRVDRKRDVDFNADGRADIAVFRRATGQWLIKDQPGLTLGTRSDVPVPGDYDGNGFTDAAVYRPSTGEWFIQGLPPIVWGLPGDVPVPSDYDGDGIVDIAVFRPSLGSWQVRGGATVAWGAPGDIPVPGDYTGDGASDFMVYRPSTGEWLRQGATAVVWGLPTDEPVPADYNGDSVVDIAVFRPGTGEWRVRNQFNQLFGTLGDLPLPMDLTGDGQVELVVFRPISGTWYSLDRATMATANSVYGLPGDLPLQRRPRLPVEHRGDIDGDRRADLTVFRPANGAWYSRLSASNYTSPGQILYGLATDIPVTADYNGDGATDIAVFRPSTGVWYVRGILTRAWGTAGDIPVPGDYDGDARADLAVYRPSLGTWNILYSATNFTTQTTVAWGVSTDIPVPGDYDGDGRADLAVFRGAGGGWLVKRSSTNYTTSTSVYYGTNGDVPVPADYDGDGRVDPAVFRPASGTWYNLNSSTNFTTSSIVAWGLSTDTPVPGDFNADGRADIAVFRGSSGTWYVRNILTRQWGAAGDIPVLGR